jgi:hypothetical protein
VQSSVDAVLSGVSPKARKAFLTLLAVLTDELGANQSVRSGVISFTIGNNLLAAAHPRKDAVDLALSLPLDDDRYLFDAIDFKWRNLPAAISIEDAKTGRIAADRVRKAAKRLKDDGVVAIPGGAFSRPDGDFQPQFKDGFRRRQ